MSGKERGCFFFLSQQWPVCMCVCVCVCVSVCVCVCVIVVQTDLWREE